MFLQSMNYLISLEPLIYRTFAKVVLVDSHLSDRLEVFGHHDDCFLSCKHMITSYSSVKQFNKVY